GMVENLKLDDLAGVWPVGMGEDAREWVTSNLSKGTVSRAAVQLTAASRKGDHFTIEKLNGKIAFQDVHVDYLSPMPPVSGVDGEAYFDADNLLVETKGGKVLGTTVKDARLHISGLRQYMQYMDIKMG